MVPIDESTPPPCVGRRFDFLGGDPCLDFVNTVDWWRSDSPRDRVRCYEDLLDWSEQAGLFGSGAGDALRPAAAKRAADAERALRRARTFRASLYRILAAAAAADPPDAKDLHTITVLARRSATHSRLEIRGDRFIWSLNDTGRCDLEWPVWELARAAVALLTSEVRRRIRQCADEKCGWFFIDQSRNHSRRWCDMRSCGNRAKARRSYARSKRDPQSRRR